MKYTVIFAAFLAVALAAPQGPRTTDDSQTQVVRYVNENDGLGDYHFTYDEDYCGLI